MYKFLNKYLSIIFITSFIVSCGGGGGGGGGSSSPNVPLPSINLSSQIDDVLIGSNTTITWSSTNATSCSASWTSQTSTSGSEEVTISNPGNNNFAITCSGSGGSSSESITIEGYRVTDGVTVDGYISNATIFIDENENWSLDSNENSTTSDVDGKFTIRYSNGNLISLGGSDFDTQVLIDNFLINHKLTGYTENKVITPVTSIASYFATPGNIYDALGIDPSIEISEFDPVSNKGDGGINDQLYVLGNRLSIFALGLMNAVNEIQSTTDTTKDYFESIAEEVELLYNSTNTKVDITDTQFVWNVMDNVTAKKNLTYTDEMQDDYIKSGIFGLLPVIEIKSTPQLTDAVMRFALSTFQDDIKILAMGGQTADDLDSQYSGNILEYIAADQDIDANDITPNIYAIADNISIDEDTEITILILENDNYLNSAPISVTATSGSIGTTNVVGNYAVQYTPLQDQNGTDSFEYTIQQGDKTSSATVSISINPINDLPTIDVASTIRVTENETYVTSIKVSDVDGDDLTVTLGGTDADSFNLSSENVLTFKEPPDYETKSSYSIMLLLNDGTVTVDRDVTVSILDINDSAPVFTSESTFSAAENQTNIGKVTAYDPEGNNFTFSISDNDMSITPGGSLSFIIAPDYETKNIYTSTVSVNDTDGNSATQDITVNITNVNDNSPNFTSNAIFSVIENQTSIGRVTATDEDGDDVTFTISGSELEITSTGVLTFIENPDYETKSIYTATVTASDGINKVSQQITINIDDINESPKWTISFPTSSDYEEGNRSVEEFNIPRDVSDEDGDEISFSLAGIDASLFVFDDSSKILSFITAPDFENPIDSNQDNIYKVNIIATDGALSETSPELTYNITNINDNTPVITSSYSFIADENQTSIGTVTATDADGDAISFSVVGSELQITEEGILSFVTPPDYETKYSYSGTVTATDGQNSTSQSIKITIRDLRDTNEAPTITSSSSFIANENQTSIGSVEATDADGDAFTFSITGSDILIDSSSGLLTFVTAPDYESNNIYNSTVTVTDGTDSSSQDITVSIINLNDNSPVITSSSSFNVEENILNIGTITASDADGDALTYSIDNNVDQVIDVGVTSSSGLAYTIANEQRRSLTLEAGKTYSFNHSSSHPLRFSTSNDGIHNGGSEYTSGIETFSGITKITVTNSTPSTLYYYCRVHSGMGGSVTVSSDTSTIIDINAVSGELTFGVTSDSAGSPDPDFEKMPFYDANVSVTDGISTATQSIEVNLTDIDVEGVVFTSSASYTVDENQLQIGSVSAVSASGNAVSYSANVGDEPIEINSSSGLLTFTSAPDYETKSSYTISVSASDGTSSKNKSITISINNLNDNVPVFTSASSLNVSENQSSVGTITATDADGDELTFTTISADFSISSSGLLTFLYTPDYETRNTFLLLINVTDGENTSSQNLTVNVTDVDNDSSSNYARYLEGPSSDPEHITAKYHAKHCYYTHEVNGEEESRWLWDAGLTDEQKAATYKDIQSVELTNGQTVTAECVSDYEMSFGTYLDSSTAESANNKGIYGVSQYIRIWDELPIRPRAQAGIYGQWIQPHAMHPYFTWQSIEGGLFSDDKVGRSKYPKYMASAQSHLYNGDSTQFGWGFYEKRVPCEYLGGIQIANKMLLPPNLISFDENQNDHSTDGGMFFGHGWIAMPLIGGKNRENWSNGGIDEGRDMSSGKLTWTFFVDAENFSGPLTAYAPEFWYRRVNKFNAYEILNERWEENLSTDTTFLNKTKDYIAGRITESEFVNLAKEQSWYVDGVENYDTDIGGDYMVRAKDSLAFNPVPAVALGAERDPSIGLTEIDDEGNMYLKTFLPQIPDTNNIEPFLLSGRTYGVEHYNNFVEFFESSDPDAININFETSQYTTALVQNENEGFVGADTIKYDAEENDDNWWVRSEIKDASGNSVPNKYSFEAGVGVTTETNDNGSNVYWDWKNKSKRMLSEFYKITDSDNPTNFIFERATESEVPEKLKTYTHSNLTNVTSYMPHIKTSADEELEQSIKNDMKEYFNEDLNYLDYSCRACNDENGCDEKTYSTTLDDGTIVTYRWYRFKDQPTFLQLKNEFPDIYTDEYLNKLQTQIEYIHANWINSKDFLSRPSSVNDNNLNLVEIDNSLILTPPIGKEVGWVPIAISLEAPGRKWQREVNWWSGPKRSSWDGTGSEFYRFRSW